jgi:hypothetical protein
VLIGASALVFLGVYVAIPDPVTRYTRSLDAAGLQVAPAPMRGGGGLSLSGRF